jgi:Cu/Ag efflux pump CusA
LAPLGIAYIWAIVASLLVALTVTPALCILIIIIIRQARSPAAKGPPAVHWLKGGYSELLLRVEKVPRVLMAGVPLLIVLGIGALFLLTESFLPELREGTYRTHDGGFWNVPS